MKRTGVWNGLAATVVRRDGDTLVIQVESVPALGRGKAYERILTVTAAQWKAANKENA
jgi:hypothetical protein